MNGTGPIIQQTLSTISAPEAASDPSTTPVAPPSGETGGSGAASGTEKPIATPPDNRSLELARKFDAAAEKESRARKAAREAQTKQAELEAREAKLREKEAELDAALGDPVAHLIKIGKNPVEIAKRYATPETEVEKRLRLLEESTAREKAEATEKAKQYEEQQKAVRNHALVKSFVAGINEKEHPHTVALYEPHQIPAVVSQLLNRPMDPADPDSLTVLETFEAKHRRSPTDREIRESIEAEAEDRATKLLKSRAGSVATSPGAQSQGSSMNESGPSGISNQHASVTTTGKKRPPSLEERRKTSRKELTAALEAEANDD